MFYLLVPISVIAERLGAGVVWHAICVRLDAAIVRRHAVTAAFVTLPLLLMLQLRVGDSIAVRQSFRGIPKMPIPVIDDRILSLVLSRWVHAELLALFAVGEVLALFVVYANLRSGISKMDRAKLVCAAAAMIAIALAPHALTSADLYTYVGYSLLGTHSYAPPTVVFSTKFAAINAWWGTPIVPAPYGPLWIAIGTLIAAPAATLAGKMLAFRLLGLGSLLGIAYALRRGGFGPGIVALVLVNPFLYVQFVTNGHNDIFAALLAVGAFALVRARPALAWALVVAAGLIKLPFVAIACLVFAPIPDRRRRFALAATAVGASVAISGAWGGGAYLAALRYHIVSHAGSRDPVHAVVALGAVGLLAAAFFGRYRPRAGVLAFPALGATIFPWYSIWALPYALLDRRMLAGLLIAWPALGFILESTLDTRPYIVVVLVAIVASVLRARLRRPGATVPTEGFVIDRG
ncbi:MAG: hypothetical protein ACREM8_00120 [Vulcanimicrobiaceae bacterium]